MSPSSHPSRRTRNGFHVSRGATIAIAAAVLTFACGRTVGLEVGDEEEPSTTTSGKAGSGAGSPTGQVTNGTTTTGMGGVNTTVTTGPNGTTVGPTTDGVTVTTGSGETTVVVSSAEASVASSVATSGSGGSGGTTTAATSGSGGMSSSSSSSGSGGWWSCPATQPADKTYCSQMGVNCAYGGTQCTCNWQGWSCNSCPANQPTSGSSCQNPQGKFQSVCTYGSTECVCNGGGFNAKWQCGQCPASTPTKGQQCSPYGLMCPYEGVTCNCWGSFQCYAACPAAQPAPGTKCQTPQWQQCKYGNKACICIQGQYYCN